MIRGDRNTELALERTTLAWVRTGLSMMGFGFVVARFGLFLREMEQARGVHLAPHLMSLWAGVALVLVGVATLGLASYRHLRVLAEIRSGKPEPTLPLAAVAVSIALATIGAVMAVYLVVTYR